MPRTAQPARHPLRTQAACCLLLGIAAIAYPAPASADAITATATAASSGTGAGPDWAALLNPTKVTFAASGSIDSAGVDGTPAVRFEPSAGWTAPGTPFNLGLFQVTPPADGSTTTYHRTPVSILLWTQAIDGASTAGADGAKADPLVIHGWLSGAVGSNGTGSLSVLFDQGVQPTDPRYYQPHPLPPFPAGSSFAGPGAGGSPPGYLRLDDGASVLTLDPTGRVAVPVPAAITLAPNVPEPASIVVLGALSLGLVLLRRRGAI